MREAQADRGALALDGIQGEPAAVDLHDRLDDGQAKPGARDGLAGRVAGPEEPGEQVLKVGFGDADAGVLTRHDDLVRSRVQPAAQPDGTLPRSELDRVGQDVHQRALELSLVPGDRGLVVTGVDNEPYVLLVGQRTQFLDGVADELAYRDLTAARQQA